MLNEREKLLWWLESTNKGETVCLNHEQTQTLARWIRELTERAGDNAELPVLRGDSRKSL
jgi:hypothetical protein